MSFTASLSAPPPKWSQYGFQEYLVMANPSPDVHEKVMSGKWDFYPSYQQRVAVKTIPHITLATFLARENMEESLINCLQRISNRHERFTVALHNFSGFPRHTLYIKVKNPAPFRQLANSLNLLHRYIYSNNCPPLKVVTFPHLTVARRLPEDVHYRAMQTYTRRSFNETFTVMNLVLIKRDSQFDKCNTVSTFSLRPERKNLFS